jgi:hypothetical protein
VPDVRGDPVHRHGDIGRERRGSARADAGVLLAAGRKMPGARER